MYPHDYSAQQALDLLLRSLYSRDKELGTQIQAVIDAGRDVDETEPASKRKKRTRTYRKTVPYSFEEALEVALTALQSYFIEQPRFINSSLEEIAAGAVESPMSDRHGWRLYKERDMKFDPETKGRPKAVEIEMRTETQISESARETLSLSPVAESSIEQQLQNLRRLRELVGFSPR